MRLSFIGVAAGRPRVTLEITWYLDRDCVRADWLRDARADGWRIEVTGQPNITLSVEVGECEQDWITDLTAARVINDIRIVCNAEPGTHSFLDSPIPRAW